MKYFFFGRSRCQNAAQSPAVIGWDLGSEEEAITFIDIPPPTFSLDYIQAYRRMIDARIMSAFNGAWGSPADPRRSRARRIMFSLKDDDSQITWDWRAMQMAQP